MRIPGFEKLEEPEKVRLSRRAFLRGSTVTAAGLIVPKSAVFDQGRIVQPEMPALPELPGSLGWAGFHGDVMRAMTGALLYYAATSIAAKKAAQR